MQLEIISDIFYDNIAFYDFFMIFSDFWIFLCKSMILW